MKPKFVPVRPRVLAPNGGDSELLSDALDRINNLAASDGTVKRVLLAGCGKKTALHLLQQNHDSARQAEGETSLFQRICSHVEISIVPNSSVDEQLQLAPWGMDELIEYLLANHAQCCNSVMEAVVADQLPLPASPAIWQPILELMAASKKPVKPVEAALQLFDQSHSADPARHTDRLLDAMIGLGPVAFFHQEKLVGQLSKLGLDLLRIGPVQDEILARRVATRLHFKRDRRALQAWMTGNLLTRVASNLKDSARAIAFLTKCFKRNYLSGVVGSILMQLDSDWRPSDKDERLELHNGEFEEAHWNRIRLTGHNLRFARLNYADLRESLIVGCTLQSTRFRGAQLDRARIIKAKSLSGDFNQASAVYSKIAECEFRQVNFRKADLESGMISHSHLLACDFTSANLAAAKFSHCRLYRCQVSEAALEDCIFDHCYLSNLSFSEKQMANVSFSHSNLNTCNFEDASLDTVDFAHTRLTQTLYTDSTARNCNFRDANLKGAGLAGITWTDCDFTGANLSQVAFHLGSSRSGIVNSPFPSHGTRTGFYTDDIEELDCKPPETIRKAALLDCDLRGANLDGVDFYLVDLRGSNFDEKYRKHLVGCGAILS